MFNDPAMRKMRNDDLAFGVVVLASYIMLFTYGAVSTHQPGFLLLMTALMLAFLVLALWGERYIGQLNSTPALALFFALELALGGLVIYLANGAPWLLLLPIASQAISMLPGVWAAVVCGLIMVLELLPALINGSINQVVSGGIAFLAALVFVAVFTIVTMREQRAREELSAANQKLREYAVRVEELATTQERNRLAREIHDGLGHYLTAINIQIRAAQAVLKDQPEQAETALNNAQTLAQEALADVRRSISALRADPTTNRPLVEILRGLMEETRAAGVEVDLWVQGTPCPLPEQVEFTLFRTAQEGLTNVRKHAQAARSMLMLEFTGQVVRLEVRDNGLGSQSAQGGYGLTGLRERVELLHGRLEVETSPGKGFCLRVELPVEGAGQEKIHG